MMDIIIPLHDRSAWNHNELRYALRSIKFEHDRVWVIGSKPDWLHNVIHLPLRDKTNFPATNIYQKLMYACETEGVSDNFMMLHDDHYLLPSFQYDAAYYEGDVERAMLNCKDYLQQRPIMNTVDRLLRDRQASMKYFDISTPMMFNKKAFVEAMLSVDWMWPYGYCIKTIYCNYHRIDGVESADGRVNVDKTYSSLLEFSHGRVCLSSADKMNDDFKRFLQTMFPEKSKYEL
jgi:hypothetical protein